MIGVGLVDYGDAQISGIRLRIMPIEDFSYTVFAVLALPALWTLLGPAASADRAATAPAGPATSVGSATPATTSPEDLPHDR